VSAAPQSSSAISHLECPRCAIHFDADKLTNICPCRSPLLARYDMTAASVTLAKAALAGRIRSMWRYSELLPVRDIAYRATLNEGWTPLTPLQRLGHSLGVPELWLKDESFNPGGTFKARGASCAVSRAAELGAQTLGISTNGNAGEALAAYAARGAGGRGCDAGGRVGDGQAHHCCRGRAGDSGTRTDQRRRQDHSARCQGSRLV
jgi:threonine synthase